MVLAKLRPRGLNFGTRRYRLGSKQIVEGSALNRAEGAHTTTLSGGGGGGGCERAKEADAIQAAAVAAVAAANGAGPLLIFITETEGEGRESRESLCVS